MRAPGFWRHDGVMARLLSPLAAVYGAGASVSRRMTKTRRAPIPVVCVGNLVAGGAGKTPVVLSLFERLSARDKTVHFLSRGYGGQEEGPVKVDAERHLAEDVGDEPLLLARHGFCWVARDRQSGAAAAVRSGADVLLMDDGLQNPSLLKDLSLMVVDGGYGFGNGRLLPAGPLRESIEDGLRRVDAVVLLGEDRTGVARQVPEGVDLLHADIVPRDDNTVAGKTVYAFAGIGRPEKFFETLETVGCRIAATKSFADHHIFNPAEIGMLLDRAAIHEATPVTTEKDWVRLPKEVRDRFATLPIEVRWRDAAALDALLDRIV